MASCDSALSTNAFATIHAVELLWLTREAGRLPACPSLSRWNQGIELVRPEGLEPPTLGSEDVSDEEETLG